MRFWPPFYTFPSLSLYHFTPHSLSPAKNLAYFSEKIKVSRENFHVILLQQLRAHLHLFPCALPSHLLAWMNGSGPLSYPLAPAEGKHADFCDFFCIITCSLSTDSIVSALKHAVIFPIGNRNKSLSLISTFPSIYWPISLLPYEGCLHLLPSWFPLVLLHPLTGPQLSHMSQMVRAIRDATLPNPAKMFNLVSFLTWLSNMTNLLSLNLQNTFLWLFSSYLTQSFMQILSCLSDFFPEPQCIYVPFYLASPLGYLTGVGFIMSRMVLLILNAYKPFTALSSHSWDGGSPWVSLKPKSLNFSLTSLPPFLLHFCPPANLLTLTFKMYL